MGIAHDPGIIAVGTQVCPRCIGRSLQSFGARSEPQWMSGRGRGSAQTRARARRAAATRAEDGAGTAAIATAQEGLSEEEKAAGRAALELVEASELGDEVKAQVANLGSRLLDQQEANAELRAQVEALRSAVNTGSGGSDAEYADADGLPGSEVPAVVAEPADEGAAVPASTPPPPACAHTT
eukprot:SAG11_NODE_1641_length_4530_cov_6.481607_3_plen_182_part_00